MGVAIVIPTYNERANIEQLIPKIRNATSANRLQKRQAQSTSLQNIQDLQSDVHIVIVDDNSSDGTGESVLQSSQSDKNLHLLRRPKKMGLGSAYLDAFRWVTSNLDVNVVVQMDADMSHPPGLLPQMIQTISNGQADVIVASRYLASGRVENWPIHRRLISKVANSLARSFLGINVRDITSGYRAYNIGSVRKLLGNNLSSSGYEYQIEVLYILSKLDRKIVEMPFVFSNRVDGKSKLRVRDIVRFLSEVINLRLKPRTLGESPAMVVKSD